MQKFSYNIQFILALRKLNFQTNYSIILTLFAKSIASNQFFESLGKKNGSNLCKVGLIKSGQFISVCKIISAVSELLNGSERL